MYQKTFDIDNDEDKKHLKEFLLKNNTKESLVDLYITLIDENLCLQNEVVIET